MQEFTGIEYLQIDIANNFGMDKLSWEDRLLWFYLHKDNLMDNLDKADNPMLAAKGLHVWNNPKEATGFIMGLDATASGLQLLAVLSGCEETAKAVNLIDTGKRQDVYSNVVDKMNQTKSMVPVTRKDVKKNVMTHYYNSSTTENLDTVQETVFYKTLDGIFPGPEQVMDVVNDAWGPNNLYHEWTLPDGHVAHVRVTGVDTYRVDIDELKTQVSYRYERNAPSKRFTSLCPNFIHSLDGWVCREMVRRAHKQGFQLAHIHDSMWAHPNNMNHVRRNYREILAELCTMPVLSQLIASLTGEQVIFTPEMDLTDAILASEYALS